MLTGLERTNRDVAEGHRLGITREERNLRRLRVEH